ncbi:chloramphenicol acetyltransferase [Marivirga sp. S37H4]|uniref:Chloramphenicol acetyltransferase n=1 Tax=Marivirga aurantiaca TaxID=2802615 RepID=A0A934WYK5_9BACT|nr:chloramphenicol acetyltransferase [Marivirga aurantiaca]MBK6265296.1 chloramphenicol acetyltransferase [Marivirga aurantiaca]
MIIPSKKELKKIDLNNYNRKEHYEFFKDFHEPFFGVAVEIDCTEAYQYCRLNHLSFYQFYTYQILKAVNEVKELRYRIIDHEIYDVGKLHVSATVLRTDKTFGFSRILYEDDFGSFSRGMKEEIEKVKNTEGLNLYADQYDVIHFSATPWLRFSSLSHSRHFKTGDSIPKVAVGKTLEENGRITFPVSIHVNHALVDGYHLSLVFEKLEQLLNTPAH